MDHGCVFWWWVVNQDGVVGVVVVVVVVLLCRLCGSEYHWQYRRISSGPPASPPRIRHDTCVCVGPQQRHTAFSTPSMM